MDVQHRLARQAIDIAISKAINDMKSDTKRGLRNLVDLGLYFSKSDEQKAFFGTAREMVANPQSPHYALAARTIAGVDHDTIKKAGINLGYSSLIYGAKKLRARQADADDPLPWFLIFDFTEPGARMFSRMARFISEGRELGIYSYILRPRGEEDIIAICDIVKGFDDCLFVLALPSELITERSAELIGGIHQMVVSLEVSDQDMSAARGKDAMSLLRKRRCLFGVHIRYDDANAEQVTSLSFVREVIDNGCAFGVYVCGQGASFSCQEAVYNFACRERGVGGRGLITLEWARDIRYISERILPGGGYMKVNLADSIFDENRKEKGAVPFSLPDILRMPGKLLPCSGV